MFGKKTDAHIDGEGNIVIQDVSNSTITINPDNSEEIKKFLIEFSQRIAELPLEIISILEEKSKEIERDASEGANLHLAVMLEAQEGIGVRGLSFGVTITNLNKEIRYFNQPYFKVSPMFQLEEGLEHDTFLMMQRQGLEVTYPCRLEYGQPIQSLFPVNANAFQVFEQNNSEEAFIQAFVTTTLGELYSSNKYLISKFVEDNQSIMNR